MTDSTQPPVETFGSSESASETPIGSPTASVGAPMIGVQPEPVNPANLLGGILLGALGAVVATVLWILVVVITEYQLGIVAIAVGFIVGWATLFGASRKRSVLLAILSAVFTLLAMALSEYFIVRHFAIQQLAAEGYTGDVALFLPLADIIDIITESLGENPTTLLFWAIALFEAFVIPFRGGTRRG
jgi:hypothetical protein